MECKVSRKIIPGIKECNTLIKYCTNWSCLHCKGKEREITQLWYSTFVYNLEHVARVYLLVRDIIGE